jgi:hypothetical protein
VLPRERVIAALGYRPPDVIPLRIAPVPSGLYEHGQKLLDLIQACGHDFGDLSGVGLPAPPPPEDFDPDGRYHAFATDAWGVRWEYRIFGIWGHPLERPLDDWSRLDAYEMPTAPAEAGPDVDADRERIAGERERYYVLGGFGQLFELLRAVRRYEDVLMDLADDSPEIGRLADMITDHYLAHVKRSLAVDVDGIAFGDDHGTQQAMITSPAVFRSFFAPRYERWFEPVRAAGKSIFFHVCGQIDPILEDFARLGVSAIWPQLNAFDVRELARACRDLGVAVELHPDRGDLMQRATPGEVRDYVLRLVDTFDASSGGSWLYLEVDPGFPWANVEALFGVAMELRGM